MTERELLVNKPRLRREIRVLELASSENILLHYVAFFLGCLVMVEEELEETAIRKQV